MKNQLTKITVSIGLLVTACSSGIVAQAPDSVNEPASHETRSADSDVAGETRPDFDAMSAREFFELIDFGDSYLAMFVDGEKLGVGEQEAVIRGLTRIRRLQPHRITHWLQLDVPWKELTDNPDAYRLDVFLLTGKVEGIRKINVPEEAAPNVGMSVYFEVDVLLNGPVGPKQGILVVENLPVAWAANLGQPAVFDGQPFSCPGIFLKPYQTEDNEPGYIFATSKISWHPNQVSPALGVTSAKVRFAEQGVDIGELSAIQDRAKFAGREREPFYQMLATVGRLPSDQQTATVNKTVSELLTLPQDGLMVAPEAYRAEFIDLSGVCRRITRIEIDDADIQARLGIDHYYEVSVFVPIPAPIVSQRPGDESSRKEFAHEYPVLVCVPELPEGVRQGDQLHLSVAMTGAFFKLWAYRTPFMSGEEHTRRQISPLFVAGSLERDTEVSEPQVNQFVFAILLILAFVIGVGVTMGMIFSRKSSSRRR